MGLIKIRASSVAKRVFSPNHFFRLIKLSFKKNGVSKTYDDAQLSLYAKLLNSEFLHYGYFDEIDVSPERLSLFDIKNAQKKYAELILERIADRSRPVLDVGCGMGGLSKMIFDQGMGAVALTPDQTQARFIRKRYPEITEILECRYEDIPEQRYLDHFGTVIASESFQYLELNRAVELTSKLLKAGGRWIICDYFRKADAFERSGHRWKDFEAAIEQKSDFKLVEKIDITPHVLPTLSYVTYMAERLLTPGLAFVDQKLSVKKPRLHYALEDVLSQLHQGLQRGLEVVDPARFAREKQYLLVVLERQSSVTNGNFGPKRL